METSSQTLPDQQQPGQSLSSNYPQAVPLSSSSSSSSSSTSGSGSIGPFFAVISVLTVLAFLSCVLGRKLSRDQTVLRPLESINHGHRISCAGWLKRKCRQLQCMVSHHDLEVGPNLKVIVDPKVKQGEEVPPPHPPPQP
ncbi:unnamed protein product [Prunus armeniaca]|uniref:Transmembrane protein n=1 Tax=Prunus armeniaca TaxID=36596 RepID=A0A6J5XKU1_PRUAR|nr:unnamed protein product [Prunus armeniaca]